MELSPVSAGKARSTAATGDPPGVPEFTRRTKTKGKQEMSTVQCSSAVQQKLNPSGWNFRDQPGKQCTSTGN
jgi:hypothetical protein